MTPAHRLTAVFAVVVCIGLFFVGNSWLKEHDARLTLAAQTQANNDGIAAIQEKDNERVKFLESALSSLSKLQDRTKTTPQVVAAAPQVIDVPTPIRQVTQAEAAAAPSLSVDDIVIPAIDVKPLFDAQVACKKCELANASLKEQVTNLTAISTLKDKQHAEDVQALKGGTKMQRFTTAAKWMGVGGAVVGVVAVTLAIHH